MANDPANPHKLLPRSSVGQTVLERAKISYLFQTWRTRCVATRIYDMFTTNTCDRLSIFAIALLANLPFQSISKAEESKRSQDDIPAAFAILVAQLNRLDSIAYRGQAVSKSSSPNDPSQMLTLNIDFEFKMSKDRYYSEYAIVADGKSSSSMMRISAFDGNEFQGFDANQSHLTTNGKETKATIKLPYGMPQPIMIPFTFILETIPYQAFESLKEKTYWDRLVSKGRITGSEKVEGLDCLVLTFDDLGDGRRAIVRLARSLDFYPLLVEFADRRIHRTHHVTKFRLVQTNRGLITIPLKIESKTLLMSGGSPAPMTSSSSIDESSLKINEFINDSEFTLSKTQAKRYDDYKNSRAYVEGKELRRSPAEIARRIEGGRSPFSILLLAISIGLIAIGVCLGIRRRMSTDRSK